MRPVKRKSPPSEAAGSRNVGRRAALNDKTKIARPAAKRPASPPAETEWRQCDRLWFLFKPDCKVRARRAYAGELAGEGFAKNLVFLPAEDEALVAVVRRESGGLVRRYCRMSGFSHYARNRGEETHAALFDALRSERILGVDETRDAMKRVDDLYCSIEAHRRRHES